MPRSKKTTAPEVSDKASVVRTTAEELLTQMQISATVEVVEDEGGVFQVQIQTEETGLLIGYHGETLTSLQLILGLIVSKKLGEWVRVVVEVGDYRAKRADQLRAMAQSYASQALATGQPVYLPYLPPNERRIVHLALQERNDVTSESEGEGPNRRVVVKPRTG